MRRLILLFVTLSSCLYTYSQETTEIDSAEIFLAAYNNYIDSLNNTFNYEYGAISISDGRATLSVPDGYKYLNEEQSHIVLEELWGNPPSDVDGMLFPDSIGPLSDPFTYAVEIVFEDSGYIKDDDAAEIDYDDLLADMQAEVEDQNPLRQEQGYPTMDLIGWASPPFYDGEEKKLHWAKELKFETSDINTLNYNIRILGRRGVLNLNVIGDMDVLPQVQTDIDDILHSVQFNPGHTYSEFDPNLDKVAAYGIGGLIAGKVLAKAGFFALLAKFWKIIAIGAVAAFAAIRKFFTKDAT